MKKKHPKKGSPTTSEFVQKIEGVDPGPPASPEQGYKAELEAHNLLEAILPLNIPAAANYIRKNPPSPEAIAKLAFYAYDYLTSERASNLGTIAADMRHDQPSGSRDKRERIREFWATGRYKSRNQCAEKCAEKIGMSIETARKALRNTPDPKRT